MFQEEKVLGLKHNYLQTKSQLQISAILAARPFKNMVCVCSKYTHHPPAETEPGKLPDRLMHEEVINL